MHILTPVQSSQNLCTSFLDPPHSRYFLQKTKNKRIFFKSFFQTATRTTCKNSSNDHSRLCLMNHSSEIQRHMTVCGRKNILMMFLYQHSHSHLLTRWLGSKTQERPFRAKPSLACPGQCSAALPGTWQSAQVLAAVTSIPLVLESNLRQSQLILPKRGSSAKRKSITASLKGKSTFPGVPQHRAASGCKL